MIIKEASSARVEEILQKPFGFKGTSVESLTVSHVCLKAGGHTVYGSGIQSVLWSDGNVFSKYGLRRGDDFMHDITRYALGLLKGSCLEYPPDILYELFEKSYRYAVDTSGMKDLRKTFVLNALVPVDNAMWLLYSKTKGITSFDHMLEEYKGDLCCRNEILAAVPLITYGVTSESIEQLLNEGYYFLKIKIGNGLEWDKARVKEIHRLAGKHDSPYTSTGKPFLYLDANGLYKDKDELLKLIDHMDREGILPYVSIIEEPFSEEYTVDVRDLPVRIAGDESCHQALEAAQRIDQGYGAIALKPIAKTLTAALDVLKEANRRNVPCFCADLTVTPLLVEWNKNFAARLKAFPGTKGGVLESNGSANYRNWEEMLGKLPYKDKGWVRPDKGVYRLDEGFYETSSGIYGYYESEGLNYTGV
jgi:L-alanine-DL-glutamate epimerase-like enolase superfamily enzyme